MATDRIVASLAAASLFAVSPVIGGASDAALGARMNSSACTPEVHRCLAKLESRLVAKGRTDEWTRVDRASIVLQTTDPECGELLRSLGINAF